MKVRISATIDPSMDKKINEFLKNSKYRNKSHLIEESIDKFIEENKKDGK